MYQICSRCVLTDQIKITFDERGVCNFCHEYERKEKERKAAKLHPGKEWTIYEIKKAGENKPYDVLIGLSGGVDSSMALHYIVKEWELRPLCYSIDNGYNDPRSDENIMRLVETLKVPFYRYTIDYEEFVALQIAFVRAGIKNIEVCTDHILLASGYEMANKYEIKYIVNGGNLATEGIMPEDYGEDARDLRFLQAVYGEKIKNLPILSLLKYIYYRFIKRIKVVQVLDFYEYKRKEAIKFLEKEYGYKEYGEKHGESIFTRWFQNFYLPKKFNLDKRRPHLSSMINSVQITREEALEELKKPLLYPELGCEEKVLKYPVQKKNYGNYKNSQKMRKLLSGFYASFR